MRYGVSGLQLNCLFCACSEPEIDEFVFRVKNAVLAIRDAKTSCKDELVAFCDWFGTFFTKKTGYICNCPGFLSREDRYVKYILNLIMNIGSSECRYSYILDKIA